jgi:hypothetical protein
MVGPRMWEPMLARTLDLDVATGTIRSNVHLFFVERHNITAFHI